MGRFSALAMAAVALPLLNGCAIAVLPVIAAGGAIGKKQLERKEYPASAPLATQVIEPANALPAPGTGADAALIKPGATMVTAEPLTEQAQAELSPAYMPLLTFVEAQLEKQRAAILPGSVVPVGGVSLTDPQFMACSGQPNAVMIDLDREGGLLADDAQVVQTGLLPALAELRAKKISIVWISGERQTELDALRAKLEKAGLVPEGGDEILFPVSARSRKQTLRIEAASRLCVLAMAGDKRADFDELYDYLIDPESAIMLERHFGAGWFITPAPFQLPATATTSEGPTQ